MKRYTIDCIELERVSKKYEGISARQVLCTNKNEIIIVIDRKSRIIMKDGHNIARTASILLSQGAKKVSIATNAPVCSKTTMFLKKRMIEKRQLSATSA